MKIKILKQDPITGYNEYATLHSRYIQQSLSQNQTYTFSHTGVGEGMTILYTGSVSITNITVDGTVILNQTVPITSNPAYIALEWSSSMSVTVQATAASNLFVLFMGT